MLKDVDGKGTHFTWSEKELSPIEVTTKKMKEATCAYQKACYENLALLSGRAETLIGATYERTEISVSDELKNCLNK